MGIQNREFFKSIDTSILLEDRFHRNVEKKYHFMAGQKKDIIQLSFCLKQMIEGDVSRNLAGWWSVSEGDNKECILFSLGPAIDCLESDFSENGKLLEAYMVDCIASELLLEMYEKINLWMQHKKGKVITKYHFLGSDEQYPIERISSYIDKMNCKVEFLQEKSLSPKKSVIFVASLSSDRNEACHGICATCCSVHCERRE